MALSWLITYENEGKKGNDFSTIEPFRWLIKYREKLPNLILVNWSEESFPLNQLPLYDAAINIEKDLPEVFGEEEPEKPKLSPEELKQRRLDGIEKAKKDKAELKE